MKAIGKGHLCFLSLVIVLKPLWGNSQGRWQEKMKGLAEVVSELLPELVSQQGNIKLIEKHAKTLSELSHDLNLGQKIKKLSPPSDLDPSIQFLAEQFSRESRQAYSAIQQGQIGYGKARLRAITSYCIACHTRHENGPDFPVFPLNPKVEHLGREEKAEVFIATRQFDKGFTEFLGVISDEEVLKNRPLEWERPLRNAIAIAVRVKKDPELAAQVIEQALKLTTLVEFQRKTLLVWKEAVESWKKEPKKELTTEKKLVEEMTRLFQDAKEKHSYFLDHRSEIQYLRASTAAHDVLRVAKEKKIRAKALLVAGSTYEILSNPVLWPMHDLYYEACIREFPRSSLATDCYDRFERSVYFGYTGSAGTEIPQEVRNNLEKLKSLAEWKEKKEKGKKTK